MTRLVRVCADPEDLGASDIEVLEWDGYLWFEIEASGEPGLVPSDRELKWYRSLATGAEHLWYNHEIEEMSDGQEETPAGG